MQLMSNVFALVACSDFDMNDKSSKTMTTKGISYLRHFFSNFIKMFHLYSLFSPVMKRQYLMPEEKVISQNKARESTSLLSLPLTN